MMLPAKVRERLKYYVYLYVDPRDRQVFYVGKGKGARCHAHIRSPPNTKRGRIIRELRTQGKKPDIEFLSYGLTEQAALDLEAAAIDLLGLNELANEVRGHRSRTGRRGSYQTVVDDLTERPANIKEKAVLIVISRAFRYGMSAQELYDATRSAWIANWKRHDAKYAMSVYGGIVREVYEIATWVRGGTTMKFGDPDNRAKPSRDRWEFVGRVAEETVRRRYVGRSVGEEFFPPGAQNPIRYVNC